MSEWEDKLNAILKNPDAMAQVMDLARSLGGGDAPRGAAPQEHETPKDTREKSGGTPPSPSDLFSGLDPALLTRLLPLLGEWNSGENDKRLQLLYALQPFLKPERAEKVERAIKAARLIHMGKKFLTTMGDPHV